MVASFVGFGRVHNDQRRGGRAGDVIRFIDQTAGARYTAENQISAKDLKRWLAKSMEVQWDYQNIVKRKGRLERLK